MIIHLTGADTYRSAQRLTELRSAFVAKHDPSGFNTISIDASEATFGDLKNALGATGFFAKKRFVAIDRWSNESPVSPAELVPLLVSIADPKHDVIVVVREISKTSTTAAKRKPKSTTRRSTVTWPPEKREEFPALSPVQAATWIQREVSKHGGTFVPAAAQRLVSLCANDTWRMATEAEKLRLYTAGQPITVADVEAMVMSEANQDIFALTDALGARQTSRALELLHRELAAGTNVFALIASLASHIRNLWQVKAAQERHQNAAEIATELGLHPFVVQKSLVQSRVFTAKELQDIHHRLLQVDQTLKTSPLDAETLLDLVVLPT